MKTITPIVPLVSNTRFTELAKVNADIDGLDWLINQCDPTEDKDLLKEYKKQKRQLKSKKKEILGGETEQDVIDSV